LIALEKVREKRLVVSLDDIQALENHCRSLELNAFKRAIETVLPFGLFGVTENILAEFIY
jgi:hypothetical protein